MSEKINFDDIEFGEPIEERELGFRQNCISNCALGRCKSSYGYVWRLNYE